MDGVSETENRPSSTPSATISREIVGLLKELLGRGPTKARTYVEDDCVVVLMREGHTKTEDTRADLGEARGVAQQRVDISDGIKERLIEVVERATGRRVVGFMTTSQQDPDLLGQIYVLETAPLLRSAAES
jgi:uncharacterized protein YbcI